MLFAQFLCATACWVCAGLPGMQRTERVHEQRDRLHATSQKLAAQDKTSCDSFRSNGRKVPALVPWL